MAMEMSAEVMGTWAAIAGLVVGYMKEKNEAAKSLGKLEEKVDNLIFENIASRENVARLDERIK